MLNDLVQTRVPVALAVLGLGLAAVGITATTGTGPSTPQANGCAFAVHVPAQHALFARAAGCF